MILTLIAESKTMMPCDVTVSHEILSGHSPIYDAVANEIMQRVGDLTPEVICGDLKVSAAMARRIKEMCYEFPNKRLGQEAITAYTGVVFKALDYPSLSCESCEWIDNHTAIISSVYGWLRPTDIVKPYRMEFGAPLGQTGQTLSAFWKAKVTTTLVKRVMNDNVDCVVNLLPADAARCIDWKLLKRCTKVYKVDFAETDEKGEPGRTPNSTRLKTLRGHLLHEMASANCHTQDDLISLSTNFLLPLGTSRYPDHILFQC